MFESRVLIENFVSLIVLTSQCGTGMAAMYWQIARFDPFAKETGASGCLVVYLCLNNIAV